MGGCCSGNANAQDLQSYNNNDNNNNNNNNKEDKYHDGIAYPVPKNAKGLGGKNKKMRVIINGEKTDIVLGVKFPNTEQKPNKEPTKPSPSLENNNTDQNNNYGKDNNNNTEQKDYGNNNNNQTKSMTSTNAMTISATTSSGGLGDANDPDVAVSDAATGDVDGVVRGTTKEEDQGTFIFTDYGDYYTIGSEYGSLTYYLRSLLKPDWWKTRIDVPDDVTTDTQYVFEPASSSGTFYIYSMYSQKYLYFLESQWDRLKTNGSTDPTSSRARTEFEIF